MPKNYDGTVDFIFGVDADTTKADKKLNNFKKKLSDKEQKEGLSEIQETNRKNIEETYKRAILDALKNSEEYLSENPLELNIEKDNIDTSKLVDKEEAIKKWDEVLNYIEKTKENLDLFKVDNFDGDVRELKKSAEALSKITYEDLVEDYPGKIEFATLDKTWATLQKIQEITKKLGFDEVDNDVKEVNADISELKQNIQDVSNSSNQVDVEVNTNESVADSVNRTVEATEELKATTKEIETIWIDLEDDAISYEQQIAETERKIADIVTLLEAAKSGDLLNSEEIQKYNSDLEKLRNRLAQLKEKQAQLTDETNKNTKSTRDNSSAHRGHSNSLLGGLGNILRYALGIRTLFTLFSRLRSAAKEGLGYAANYSSVLRTSINNLTNSFTMMKAGVGAAIAPLINAVSPIITRLAVLFTQAANAVARFFAILTGKRYVVQAKLNLGAYTKAASGAGKATKDAAKDIKNSLAPFDDLQVLAEDTADALDDVGGGAGGLGDTMGSDMFTTLDLDTYSSEFLDKIRDWIDKLNLEPITEAWEHLKQVLGDFFDLMKSAGMWVMENVLFPLGTWLIESALPPIIDAIAYAIDILNISLEILAPYLVQIFNYLKPLFEFIGNVVVTALEWVRDRLKDLRDWLDENRDEPMAVFIALGIVVAVIWLLWEVLHKLKEKLTDTKTAADETTPSVFNLSETFGRFLDRLGAAFVIGTVAFLLQGLAAVIEQISNLLTTMNETGTSSWELLGVILVILVPLTVAIGALLVVVAALGPELLVGAVALDLIAVAVVAVAKAIETILKAITDLIDRPMRTLIEFIDKIKTDGPVVIEKVFELTTKVNKLIEEIKKLSKEIQNLGEKVKDFKKVATESCKAIEDKIRALLTLVNEKVEEFKKAMDKMTKAFNDAAKTISSTPIIIKVDTSAIDAAIGKINALVAAAQAASSISISVGGGGGGKIPGLASGGVLPPNKPFLAMLGDQKQGTNIEAPLDTIVQAMEQALVTSNYNRGGAQQVVLNIDGSELARVTLPNTLNELDRQGYNVSILEG